MDFRSVKSLLIPEGEVKELRIGGINLWKKKYQGIEITNLNSEAITDFYINDQHSYTFNVEYSVPKSVRKLSPKWTVSGLPDGITAENLNSYNLVLSGVASAIGTYEVTLTVVRVRYIRYVNSKGLQCNNNELERERNNELLHPRPRQLYIQCEL